MAMAEDRCPAHLLTGCVPSGEAGSARPENLAAPPPPSKMPLQGLLEEFEDEMDGLLTRQHHELRKQLRALVVRTSAVQRAGAGAAGLAKQTSSMSSEQQLPMLNMVDEAPVLAHGDTSDELQEFDISLNQPLPSPRPLPMPTTAAVPITMEMPPVLPGPTAFDGKVRQLSMSELSSLASQEEPGSPGLTRYNTSFHASMALALKAKRDNDWRAKMLRLTQHSGYEVANAAVIFVNAILIAWESEFSAEHAPAKASAAHFDAFMVTFCVIFLIDLVLRASAQGARFFYSSDWKWNWFDVLVVVGSLVELFAFIAKADSSWLSNSSLLRVLRLVRVARIVRALRSLRYFRDLRITISMLCEALVPLMTFVFIMCMVFLVFAIFFTDGASAYMVAQNQRHDGLTKYYGGLFISMATLFQTISGGIDWENAVEPLKNLPAVYQAVFYVYVTFSVFAMLNVVSAMFIDNTLQRSKNDRDYVVQTEIQGKREFIASMDKLFTELDPDRSGTIRLNELQERMQDPKVSAYFRAIDLNIYKVKRMFQLMDVDKSGDIDRGEFRKGCERLRGEAKELDLAILQYEVRTMTEKLAHLTGMVEKVGELLHTGSNGQSTNGSAVGGPARKQNPVPRPPF